MRGAAADLVKELGITPPKNPMMFTKMAGAVAGYGDDVPVPKLIQDDQVDYEGEFAFVIGKTCKDVTRADALDYILGYTCSDDVSAR